MIRVLLADDQAPDPKMSDLSDAELRQRCLEEYSDLLEQEKVPNTKWPDFAEGFVFLRKLVNQLRDEAYSVDCANTPQEACDQCSKADNVYNVIILDLGWFTDRTMSYDDKMRLGWKIAIDLQKHQAAPILMFSSRFLEDKRLAQTTAQNGLLPVYKTNDQACADHLLVTVRWAVFAPEMLKERRKLSEQIAKEQQQLVELKATESSLRAYQWLSPILLGAIVLNVALIGVTVVFTLVHPDTDAAKVSSVLGLLSALISGGIFQAIRYYRRGLGRDVQSFQSGRRRRNADT
jgi:CheY-like chemotaxis protein